MKAPGTTYDLLLTRVGRAGFQKTVILTLTISKRLQPDITATIELGVLYYLSLESSQCVDKMRAIVRQVMLILKYLKPAKKK